MSADRDIVLRLLAKVAYDHSVGAYKLSSGKVSDVYIDCKMAVSHGEILAPLGRLFLSQLDPHAAGVGGLTMGADPIAFSVAREADAAGRALRWFCVRKEPKKHGRQKLIEGDLDDGAKVTVVDDVVTTGGSTIKAIESCRGDRLHVVQVMVLVDREEDDGLANVRRAAGLDVPVVSMFKRSDIHREWSRLRSTLRATA